MQLVICVIGIPDDTDARDRGDGLLEELYPLRSQVGLSPSRRLRALHAVSSRWSFGSVTGFADETGEWEVVGRPYTTAGGKTAHARVQRANDPVTTIRTWGAHERIAVTRATAEEGKR